jgi:hypothetical protein
MKNQLWQLSSKLCFEYLFLSFYRKKTEIRVKWKAQCAPINYKFRSQTATQMIKTFLMTQSGQMFV